MTFQGQEYLYWMKCGAFWHCRNEMSGYDWDPLQKVVCLYL